VLLWYYMAFFAISVAMLGMTAGAVWVYVRRDRFESASLPVVLSDFSLLTAVSMPLSVLFQFCVITDISFSLTTVVAWALMMAAMAVPYVFSGVVVSLALTRSPFPRGQVYGVDLIGASVGCFAVILLLNLVDGPSAVILTGAVAAFAAAAFAASATPAQGQLLRGRVWWKQPRAAVVALLVFAAANALVPVGLRPLLVKGSFEGTSFHRFEKWNSYSRIVAGRPAVGPVPLWGPSPLLPPGTTAYESTLNIDGAAATYMYHYDGTPGSVSFLQYDLVGLAYRLPGIHKSAVIGVGGGRDILTARLFGVNDITGVELNPIFIHLLTRIQPYKDLANFAALPNVTLDVDDARSWFASTHQKFDLIQMSMIDTWAATGAGAFSLSENGLYTLEGWRAFLNTLNDRGIFTVSRWYSPVDVTETGRMISLAAASLHDIGIRDVRPYLFVACNGNIATLVLSKAPFTPEQLAILNHTVADLRFNVLLAPGQPPQAPLLRAITESTDQASLRAAVAGAALDLTAPTDNRPFFFNQLRFTSLPSVGWKFFSRRYQIQGVLAGNLTASAVLLLILFLSIVAVISTIVFPLKDAVRESHPRLVVLGTLYFSLIGMGFMLTEIALLQCFSVYLGHPIYSLSVCLFSLILASGLGSLASDRLKLNSRGKVLLWGFILLSYFIFLNRALPAIFTATTGQHRMVRILVSLATLIPLGFLLGFAFPTGLRMVEAVDSRPTPWFWGINGATGVLASVLGVILSIALGINVTLAVGGVCYLLLLPVACILMRVKRTDAEQLSAN
jgi:predicted membrane-bound spermidine synthase